MTQLVRKNLERLIAERAAAWAAKGEPLAAVAQDREFTPEEKRDFDVASIEFDGYSDRIKSLESTLEQERALEGFAPILGNEDAGGKRHKARSESWRNLDNGELAALKPGESVRAHPVFERAQKAPGNDIAQANYGNVGAMIRALATGSGGGSAIVPTDWSANLIDLARAKAAVVQAGATIIPMEAGTVKIGRRTADPAVSFRTENSTITPGDPSFDTVTLSAKTIAGIVVASLEWWQDIENSDEIITEALSRSMGQQIDLAALYGGITAGAGSIDLDVADGNPRGILAALNATLSANVLGGATNGTAQTASSAGNFWTEVIQTIYKVKRGNETPNAMLWNSQLSEQYELATDTTGRQLALPTSVTDLERYETNQIPTYTQGTMASRASDLFVGDFSELLIGTRLSIQLRPLGELYAANGQAGVIAYARMDVQPARSSAFAVYRALEAAA